MVTREVRPFTGDAARTTRRFSGGAWDPWGQGLQKHLKQGGPLAAAAGAWNSPDATRRRSGVNIQKLHRFVPTHTCYFQLLGTPDEPGEREGKSLRKSHPPHPSLPPLVPRTPGRISRLLQEAPRAVFAAA